MVFEFWMLALALRLIVVIFTASSFSWAGDAALCIGSMGAGHVGADHVTEMLRPLRHGGAFVIILNGSYYHSGGFEAGFRAIETAGDWSIQKLEEFNYMSELDRPGWLLVASSAATTTC